MSDDQKTTAEEQLLHVLQLAQEARTASSGPQWKTAQEEAIQRHGDACEALWDELYRLLDERRGTVGRIMPKVDEKKVFQRAVASRLKDAFRGVIPDLVDEACNA